MKKKHRFGGGEKKKQDMSLQITSMADIFTILLVFLLKSYASGEASITPVSAINLPKTKEGKPPTETLRLEVSSDAVYVGGKRVVPLQGFRLTGTGDENIELQPLKQAISMERGRQLASTGVTQVNGTDLKTKLDTRVTVLVDQRVPYQTLKRVMSAAASQGYTDFKLAVVKADE